MYLCIQYMIHGSSPWEFPHSEICGSMLICSSPQLIAACHVLHRLLMPRHSPCALVRLNFLLYFYSLFSIRSLNCLSFIKQIIWFRLLILHVKRFYPFAWIFFPPFGEIVILPKFFGKTFLNLTHLLIKSFLSLSSYLFVSYSSIYFIRFSMNIFPT